MVRSPLLYGRIVRAVSSSCVAHYFGSRPHEYGFVCTECSPGSIVYQVTKATRTSLYLRAFYSTGAYVDRRISIRDYPDIYVLDPLPLVHYND